MQILSYPPSSALRPRRLNQASWPKLHSPAFHTMTPMAFRFPCKGRFVQCSYPTILLSFVLNMNLSCIFELPFFLLFIILQFGFNTPPALIFEKPTHAQSHAIPLPPSPWTSSPPPFPSFSSLLTLSISNCFSPYAFFLLLSYIQVLVLQWRTQTSAFDRRKRGKQGKTGKHFC